MKTKAKDIEGFLVEKKSEEHEEYPIRKRMTEIGMAYGYNKAITEQGSRELEIVWDREKLAHIIGLSSLATNALAECHHQTNYQTKIDQWMNADIEELADSIISSQGIVTIKAKQ